MTQTKTILTVTLTALALASSMPVHAETSPTKRAALQNTAVSAAQAVKTAADKIGGHAVSVDFEHRLNRSYYDVDVVRGKHTHEVRVDAHSGQIIRSQTERNDDIPPKANVPLQQAIAAAVQKTGGKVKDAELKSKRGSTHYQVETLVNGQTYQTLIDADSGEVLSSHMDSDD